MQMKQFRQCLTIVSAALLLSGALSIQSSAQTADQNQILIKDFMFSPTTLTVKPGATVTWVNMDDEPHTVMSNTGLYRSSALDTKDNFSFKFDKPGTYKFTCSIHPRMVGTIVVQ
jgi:plastocyanin